MGSGLVGSTRSTICLPPTGLAPSEAQMMVKRLPRRERFSQKAQTVARSKGISGRRITSAPEATPECRAIQPALRPMTSTTMTRW